MSLDPSPAHRSAVRASWKAVAWLEGLTVLGIYLVLGAVFSNFCLMCGESESMSAGAKLALWTGVAALVGAPVLAARASGWPLWPIAGIVAGLAGAGGFVLGVALFGDLLAALVLGLAVEGAVAVRARSEAAALARVALVTVVTLLAGRSGLDSSEGGMSALVLLTLPAIALADTLAAAAAESSSTRPQHPPSPS
jgi:hypothetical protein